MPYVRRDARGQIESLHRHDEGGLDFLPDDHAELRAFIGSGDPLKADEFATLDAGFVRVIEDVIDTLILRNVLHITDLPAEAQTKLLSRKNYRESLGRQALQLYDDQELAELRHRSSNPEPPPDA